MLNNSAAGALGAWRSAPARQQSAVILPQPLDASLSLLTLIERWYQQRYNTLTGEDSNEAASETATEDSMYASPLKVAAAAPLQQYRRMRSEEIHYIDHPLVGVIIRLTPWQSK